ncbi:hypothetical protein [Streptomyces mexicanus]|uniref:hypothetical protein n=1 Tax=Streptomyces mexicanus TaxID=178566 RepID=UPI00365E1635
MTTDIRPDAAAHLTACQAADDLRAIREQWGDLLAAIERPPAAVWPPREYRTVDIQAAAHDQDTEPVIGRLPLTLREHPAPLNLDALDAACSVERALFEACDAIAARVQRPTRLTTDPRWGRYPDPDDQADPRRWHLPTHRSATLVQGEGIASVGSRAHGLHWAAVWLEGRALGEDVGDLFAPLPLPVLDDLARVARLARQRVEHALQRDGRPTKLDTPCPWCGGTLTAHTRSGDPDAAVVVCATGAACGAPAPLDRGRRAWRGADLVGLWVAMQAARDRAEEQQA